TTLKKKIPNTTRHTNQTKTKQNTMDTTKRTTNEIKKNYFITRILDKALFHPGAVHDSKIYLEILADLKRRRILKKGDLILADKGYFSFKNYGAGLMDYKIVPLIRPKKDTRKDRVFSQFNYPLELFGVENPLKKLYKQLVSKLSQLYDKWDDLKSIRSKIEDFNKFFKKGVGHEEIPSYTYKSAVKTTYLSVLLAALIVSKLKPDNKQLQQLAEM
ncbi:MAG: transposase, partial [Euryarchaeota archaeon]|nr:transposase [Euryarchaeota archaeon]